MQDDYYISIKNRGYGLYKEKGSKFIGIALPANSVSEFQAHLDNLKKEFHDARHICQAYKIGPLEYKNDDGEPAHSAGDPILGQIHSQNLDFVSVFVVRYFGGIKLGVGGLRTAYKEASHLALEDAKKISKYFQDQIFIKYPYDQSSAVLKIVSDFSAEMKEQKYEADCEILISLRSSMSEAALNELQKLEYLGVYSELK